MQSHADSLIVTLVSMSHYEPWFVDCVDFFVMSLTSQAPKILPPPLPQDSPRPP